VSPHEDTALGKGGQVGWELQRALAPLGELIALDFDSAGELSGDFTQPDAVAADRARVAPDLIVNAAAHTAVDRAESEPELASLINATTPARIALEAGGARRPPRALLDRLRVRWQRRPAPDESDATTHPLSVYGRTSSKRTGDRRFGRGSPHPAHQLGVCGARRQLRAHHAQAGEGTRPSSP
jgi:hypothetical protein